MYNFHRQLEARSPSSDFDSVTYNCVEDFVSKIYYTDGNFNKVTFVVMVEVIKTSMGDSSPGEDGVHKNNIIYIHFSIEITQSR